MPKISWSHLFDFKSLSGWFFGFTSVFSFFPLWGFPNNEIIPYFAVFCCATGLAWRTAVVPRGCIIGLSLFVFGLLALALALPFGAPATTDALQLCVVGFALFCYARLNRIQAASFRNGLLTAVLLAVGLMVLQKISPALIDLTYAKLVRRTGDAEHLLLYSGGVPGFAPEPAYMAAFLVGAFLYFRKNVPSPIPAVVAGIGIILSGSLSGVAVFAFVLILTARPMHALGFVLLLLVGLGSMEFVNPLLAARIQSFASVLSDGSISLKTLASLDEAFGSLRLFTLVEPLTSVCCGAPLNGGYQKSYSPFSVAFNLLAPFHLAVVAILTFFAPKTRFALASFVLFLTFGPVLNWLALVGLIGVRKTGRSSQSDRDRPQLVTRWAWLRGQGYRFRPGGRPEHGASMRPPAT